MNRDPWCTGRKKANKNKMPILKQKDRTDQNMRAERERKEDLEP